MPWTVSSVIGEFQFNPGQKITPAAAPQNPLAEPPQAAPVNPLARPGGTSHQLTAQPPPADVATLVANATRARDRGDYEEAVRLANEAVRQNPADKDALFVLASARYRSQQYDLFETTAAQALDAGAVIPFLVAHHHTLTGVHPAALKVSRGTITFDPLGNASVCNQAAFQAPIRNVLDLRISTSDQGETFLNLRIRDPQNKTRNFNFADSDSSVDTSGGLPRIISPPKAPRALQSILNVVKHSAGR